MQENFFLMLFSEFAKWLVILLQYRGNDVAFLFNIFINDLQQAVNNKLWNLQMMLNEEVLKTPVRVLL